MAALIRLRPKPKRPTRKTVVEEVDVYESMTFRQLVEKIPEDQWDSATFEADSYDYGDSQDFSFKYKRQETDEELGKRMVAYRRRLESYKAWQEAHKDEIEAELDRREAAATETRKRRLEADEARLRKELAKIEKQRKNVGV
jgi:hypothetical protein